MLQFVVSNLSLVALFIVFSSLNASALFVALKSLRAEAFLNVIFVSPSDPFC